VQLISDLTPDKGLSGFLLLAAAVSGISESEVVKKR